MSKIIISILLANFSVFNSCKKDTAIVEYSTVTTDTVQVIMDNLFSKGINLLGTSSSNPSPVAKLYPFGQMGNEEPVWKMPQWASRFNLLGVAPQIVNDSVIYKNQGKKVVFHKQGNEAMVNLEVYGSQEYLAPRQEGQDWPHLLLEQRTVPVRMNKLTSLRYQVTARATFVENKMGASYNPGLHTCQATLYLLVQNLNNQSAGYGDFFWFGLPMYDFRYRYIDEYGAEDAGKEDATRKYILTVAANTLFSGSFHDGQWITINKDIYPQLVSAFNKAKQKGYLKTSALADMGIESTNVGWEVPGTFDCGIQMKGLKLTGVVQ